MGVPQGSVLSPALFNFFVSDFPNTAELVASFADDFNSAVSSCDIASIETDLNSHLVDVSAWAKANKLSISAAKSSVTLFTPDRHQSRYELKVFYEGTQLPTIRTPKILGVTLDTHLSLAFHAKEVASKASRSLKVVKGLAGTEWGHQKEIMLQTFKA